MESTVKDTEGKALKAGFWYIISSFLTKGTVFLTTPIFTRIMSTEEYGAVSTYNSWLGVFTVIASLDLYSCIQIAKIDYEEKKDEFLSSIVCLSSLGVLVVGFLLQILYAMGVDLLEVPGPLLQWMFLEIFFRNIFQLLQTQHRAYFKYKEFTFFSIITTMASPIIALILVMRINENRTMGNIIGHSLPIMIISFGLLVRILYKGRCLFHKSYWLYGLKLSVPLIPHHLGSNILTHFDRVLISKYAGSSPTALYSLASSYALISNVVWFAFNNAWTPWFYDKMKQNTKHSLMDIRKFIRPYLSIFSIIALGLIAAAPEAIKIFGSSKYQGSEYAVAPIVMGVYCQFVYSLYGNIEFFHKKTSKMAKGTVAAAAANIVLNMIFIPIGGYVAAAYTTLASYAILLVLHYFMAKRIDGRDLYNDRFLFAAIMAFMAVSAILNCLYGAILMRCVLFGIAVVVIAVLNREFISGFINKNKFKKGK